MPTQIASGWETKFGNWIGRASDSEQDRYERTCRAVNEALRGSGMLDGYSFEVYAKGSYPNFTNVVRDSDVDIAVELTTFFENEFTHSAQGLSLADVGVIPYEGDATLAGFKDDVERALVAYFGAEKVDRGSKALRVAESSGRLPADVVPCVTDRSWWSRTGYHMGIRLQDDRKPYKKILNYPKQHLEEGTRKNDRTSRRYKRVVRILKRLENRMVEDRVIEVVPSFLIESAVWNVPDADFAAGDWAGRVRNALAHIFNGTLNSDCVASDDWLEANGIKYLFHASQGWTHQMAHEFAAKAWDYVGFE